MSFCSRLCAGWFAVPITEDCGLDTLEIISPTPLNVEDEIVFEVPLQRPSHLNLITNLPKYVFLNVAKEWITIFELATLDISVCGNGREPFLRHLSSTDITFTGYNVTNGIEHKGLPYSYLYWLLVRHINVTELEFCGEQILDSTQILIQSQLQQKLHKVQSLRLCHTNISKLNQLAHLLNVCPNAEELYLSMIDFDHNIFSSDILPLCVNLKVFELKQINMDGSNSTLCDIFRHCTRLQSLTYSGPKNAWQKLCTPDDASVNTPLTTLTELNLSSSRVLTDAVMDSVLTHCVSLQSLDLSNCPLLSDLTLNSLAKQHSTQLTSLSIRNSSLISDEGVTVFASSITALTSLNVSECSQLTDASLLALSKHCPGLVRLHANYTGRISDVGLEAIALRCLSLEVLHITTPFSRQPGGVTSGVLAKFIRCTSLSELQFNLGTRLPIESGVVALSKYCSLLKSVDISRNELTSDLAVSAFGHGHCRLLEGLSLYGETLTDKSIVTLAEGCPQLSLLHIREAVLLTDLSVLALTRHCTQLRELKLDGCQRLTDAALVSLANRCRQLRVLSVGGCFELTDVGVSLLVVNCTHLCDLNVQYANRLTANCVRMLKARKGLRTLKVPFK